MAISDKDCSLLFFSKTLGVVFENTLTLGRLKLNASEKTIQNCLKKYKYDGELKNLKAEYADNLFRILGATRVESLDYSDYEDASHIHDMNFPIPPDFKSKFSAIVDGGTLEHIFNFPVAIKNCMEMLEIGGHFIGISPSNNQLGHGFYQFSPELFFRVFSDENGFKVKKMLITTTGKGDWFEVTDPRVVKSRVMLINAQSLSLVVIAEKLIQKELFRIPPQQSDYETIWKISSSLKNDVPLSSESKLKFFYRKYFPGPLKIVLHLILNLFKRKVTSDELGEYSPDHFKKIEIN